MFGLFLDSYPPLITIHNEKVKNITVHLTNIRVYSGYTVDATLHYIYIFCIITFEDNNRFQLLFYAYLFQSFVQ